MTEISCAVCDQGWTCQRHPDGDPWASTERTPPTAPNPPPRQTQPVRASDQSPPDLNDLRSELAKIRQTGPDTQPGQLPTFSEQKLRERGRR